MIDPTGKRPAPKIKELLDVVIEVGKDPSFKKYEWELYHVAQLIANHVQLMSDIKEFRHNMTTARSRMANPTGVFPNVTEVMKVGASPAAETPGKGVVSQSSGSETDVES